MTPRVFAAAAAALALLVPGAAGAEKPFPTALTEDQKNNRPYAWVIHDQLPVYSAAVADANGRPAEDKKTARRLPFMKRVVVLDVDQDTKLAAVAIVGADHSISDKIGWVERKWLLESDEAMKNADRIHYKVMAVTSVAALKDDPDGEKEEKLNGADGKESVVRKVVVYNAPAREKQYVKNTISLFNVFFVYAEASGKDLAQMTVLKAPQSKYLSIDETKDSAVDPKRTYYLVGLSDRFLRSWEEDASRQILGWIPKVRTELWDTREGFVPDQESTLGTADPRRLAPAFAFRTPEDAHNWRKVGGVKTDRFDIWKEPDFGRDGVALATPWARLRFPLLRWPEDRRKDLEKLGRVVDPKVPKDPKTGQPVNRLVRVGIFRDRMDAAGNVIYTQEQQEEDNKKLDQLDRELQRTQLLFVIDETVSMDVYYQKVIPEVCEELLNSVNRSDADGRLDLRVGVAFYNDLPADSKADPDTAVDLSMARLRDFKTHGNEIIKALRSHNADPVERAKRSGGGDAPEQMFRGLSLGIRAAKFDEEDGRYARKIVILIGDYGNNDRFDKDPTGALKPNAPTAEKIAEALTPTRSATRPNPHSPIEFYAIQVIDPDGNYTAADEKSAAPGFRSQTKEILARAQERLKKAGWAGTPTRPGRSAGAYFHLERPKDVADKIKEQYAQLQKLAKDIRDQAHKIRHGIDGEWGPEMEVILDQLGIDAKNRVKASGAQLFQQGYIWEYDRNGARQVRTQILVSDGELKRLIGTLEKLDPRAGENADVMKVAAQVVDAAAGDIAREYRDRLPPGPKADTALIDAEVKRIEEENRKRSINDLVFKRMGLFTSSSPLINATRGSDGLNELTGQNLFDVLHRIDRLRDVQEGVQSQYAEKDDTWSGKPVKIRVRTKNGKPEFPSRRCSSFGGASSNIIWYWIDVDKEWP